MEPKSHLFRGLRVAVRNNSEGAVLFEGLKVKVAKHTSWQRQGVGVCT